MEAGSTDRAVAVHDEQAALFEERYRRFERDPYFDAFSYSRRKIEQALAPYLDRLSDGASLLDVGCGTGDLVRRLGGRFRCAGCDPSEEMLQRARARNPTVEFARATMDALPYPDASFDAVLCVEVIRYLAAPEPALRELARVLRPSGLCLVTFAPARSTSLYPLASRLTSRVRVPGLTHVRQYFHTALEAERLVAAAGFDAIELHARFFGPFAPLGRLSRPVASAILRRWEHVDDRLAQMPRLRDLANVFVVAARKRSLTS